MINPDLNGRVKKEEIFSLIREKGSHLVMEQLKTMLESKTGRMEEELNYLKDRIGKANIQLKRRNDLIEELEPRVIQTANILNEYRLERDTLAKEMEKLEGIEEKTFQLTERKAFIKSLTDTIGQLTEKQQELLKRFNENLSKKDKIVEDLKKNIYRRNSLDEHIKALRDKKEMLVSEIPRYSGPNECKAKKGEAERDVLKYKAQITKIKRKLTAINKKAPSLEKQAQKKLTAKDALLAEWNALRDKVAELEGMNNRETLTAEVDELKNHKKLLTEDIKNKESDLKRIASELAEAERSIEKEKVFANTAGPRLEELMVQKEEIDNAENMIKKIDLNIEVNARLQELLNSVISRLGPLNRSLGSLTGGYKAAIDGIIKNVKKGIRKGR
jgi:chromosome segregation ATPase